MGEAKRRREAVAAGRPDPGPVSRRAALKGRHRAAVAALAFKRARELSIARGIAAVANAERFGEEARARAVKRAEKRTRVVPWDCPF